MTEQTKPQGGRSPWHLLGRVASVLTAALTALALLITVYAVFCRSRGKSTYLFGYATLFVQTGSMEPTIPTHSCILVHRADAERLAVGDIVTFRCPDPSYEVYGQNITHRIVEITEDGIRTKGDHPSAVEDPWVLQAEDIENVYVTRLAAMSFLAGTFSGPMGLILIFALFAVWIAVFVIRDAVRVLTESDDMTEEEKQAAKEKEIKRRIEEEVKKLQK